jgi:ADP-ribose pyrophosphatase YjhB (NUDIX family)
VADLIYGERIGAEARLAVGCSAIVFDSAGTKLLLQRRRDNDRWCLPGGHMEPGESAEETCVREVEEEMGLHLQVTRLVGIYTTPHRIVAYPDGNRYQMVALSFEARVVSGELRLSEETTDCGYFSLAEIESLDLMEDHRERIRDALARQSEAFVR